VFDGHGPSGHKVSRFFRDSFADMLFRHRAFPCDARTAIRETLRKAERLVLRRVDCEYSGTTAAIAVVRGATLTAANVGDSGMFVTTSPLGAAAAGGVTSAALTSAAVTLEHKPEAAGERQRIESMGGQVVKQGEHPLDPHRVYLKGTRVPGLAMSRSLGDTLAHSAGVVSEPDFYERALGEGDRLLVLASDGLFDAVGLHAATRVLRKAGVGAGCSRAGGAPGRMGSGDGCRVAGRGTSGGGGGGGGGGESGTAQRAADGLVRAAIQAYDESNEEPDDITVLCMAYAHTPTPPGNGKR
jgi:serine/threonine protein phosphatase PrpC